MAAAKRDSTFGSFLVDAGNRRAHELCHAVALEQPLSPLPIVLVGEPGNGKTHLLFSIANTLRASAGHASILFVSPNTWGEEVERIIADPAPIDMARYAVLLVDDLHAFTQKYELLAKLFEVFLENDHPVVVATDAHPDRLTALPLKLRRRIRGGQTVTVAPVEARRSLAAIEERLREEQQDTIARVEQRLREMDAEGPEAAVARRQARAAELDQARREAAEARAELEHARAELALVKVSARESAQARARVQELEQRLLERAKHSAPEEVIQAPIKRKLDEARFDAQKAREEARGMLQRAQHLVEVLQQSRVTFEDAQRERERQRGEIEKLNAVFSGEKIAEPSIAEAAPAEAAPETSANEENAALQDEIHRLQESLVRARSERDTIKSHLARIREELDETRRDLERTRAETLKERTEREEHVREVQEALVTKDSEAETLRAAQKELMDEIEGLRAQVAEGTGAIERLTTLLGGTSDEAAKPEDAPESQDDSSNASMNEAPIVRADFGEGLRTPPKRTPGVHHVEELRNAANPAYPQTLPPLDDADDEYFRGTARTA